MRIKTLTAGLFALALLFGGSVPAAMAETQFPKPERTNADKKTIEEFSQVYEEIEKALQAEDVDKIMEFYSADYLHHGITKKQLKFMWLEVFTNFDDLYSVHIFTKITVSGNDAILVCTGALFGIAGKGQEYTTVDQWVAQPHWLTKENGNWKMVGGATHSSPRRRGGKLELHPFF